MVLLQVMVMSLIFSMIAVTILKLILARHIMVARIQQSAKNTGNAQGYAALNLMSWTTPPDISTTALDKPASFRQVSAGKFEITVSD